MPREFFDPTPEERPIFINTATLHEAERLIESVRVATRLALRFRLMPSSTVLPAQIRA